MEKRKTKEWQVSAFDRVNNEWTHTTNEAYEIVPDVDLVREAPPIRITPTRRKRPESAVDTLLVFGDTHHPFQDKRRLDLAQIAVRELQPSEVIFTGDDLDFATFSRFESRPEWANSAQEGIDQATETFAQTRANLGREATLTVIQGNHDFRLERQLRAYNGSLMGLRRAGEELPALALENLLRCDELDINYISGYPEADYWPFDNLKAYHGRATATASVIAKELVSENVNFVHGHGHRGELLFRTFRNGRNMDTIFGMQTGTFADLSRVPSGKTSVTERGQVLSQAHNWDSSMGLIFRHDDGSLEPHLLSLDDSGINILGKRYKS